MKLKATSLVILNTIAAVLLARLIYEMTKGSQLAVGSADQAWFEISAGVSALFGSLLMIRPILRISSKPGKQLRWAGVCALNLIVVLITHIGAGATLALRSFSRYHAYMTANSETYVFDWWQGPIASVVTSVSFSVFLFWPLTVSAGLLVAVFWLLLYRKHPGFGIAES